MSDSYKPMLEELPKWIEPMPCGHCVSGLALMNAGQRWWGCPGCWDYREWWDRTEGALRRNVITTEGRTLQLQLLMWRKYTRQLSPRPPTSVPLGTVIAVDEAEAYLAKTEVEKPEPHEGKDGAPQS